MDKGSCNAKHVFKHYVFKMLFLDLKFIWEKLNIRMKKENYRIIYYISIRTLVLQIQAKKWPFSKNIMETLTDRNSMN